ncbi:MAG: xanthine dehydrogenase family protein molybdopterin-binding subunit [Alphaproteobacteria bacterium]|nr:xanthine dehydrogenase family protein molybdopterin-binding subunit [Alphaproteobacteria bacterium]
MTPHYAFGQSVSRHEDPRLLRGDGQYAADIVLPGLAHACFLRSPHAHARIARIDTMAARAAPGVLAVLTHAEVTAAGLGTLPSDGARKRLDGQASYMTPRPLLAETHVRHVGDPVAAVIAETLGQAVDAAELIEVDYEALPAVTGVVNAAKPGGTRVWPDVADNIAFYWSAGDRPAVDRILAEAPHSIHLDFVVNRVGANPIEPRSAVGHYDRREDRYTIWTGVQMPHGLRNALAERIFKLPGNKFRVLTRDVGGSFGMKNGVYAEQPLVLFASRLIGRPVKWVADRAETMMSDEHGRDNVTTADLALDANGKFLALRVSSLVDIGAYLSPRSAGSIGNAGGIAGVYTTPVIFGEILGIHTNSTPTGPYRGAGRPEATYCIERIVDVAAHKLDIDPVELRRRNMIPASAMPYKTGFVFTYDCGDFRTVFDKALAVADHAGVPARRAAAKAAGKLWGVGVSYPIEVAGGPYVGPIPDMAHITIGPDGSTTLNAGATSMGQGNETAFAQLVSAQLGISPDRIRVNLGDSDALPNGRGNGGSSALSTGGSAIADAAIKIIDKAKKLAAHLLETAAADIEFANGRLVVAGTDRSLSLAEVARAAYDAKRLPPGMAPGLAEAGSFVPGKVNFPNGCHICEVEIDPDTGAVKVKRYTVVDDVGRVLNPLLLKGQFHGGIAQGVGQTLMENMVYDAESGQLLSGSFMDYAMPRADDLPFFEIATHEVPTATNPLGVKGAGEAGTVGSLAAVINAVVDALAPYGIMHIDMPATSERVWRAIQGTIGDRV